MSSHAFNAVLAIYEHDPNAAVHSHMGLPTKIEFNRGIVSRIEPAPGVNGINVHISEEYIKTDPVCLLSTQLHLMPRLMHKKCLIATCQLDAFLNKHSYPQCEYH